MLKFAGVRPTAAPFPHCVIDGVLPAETYARLEASYPACPPASGPTGHTIHRGDPGFDAVMAANPDWQALFDECNSPDFIARMADLFADEIDQSCTAARESLRHADAIEDRREKEMTAIPAKGLAPEDLFVRFDFMQGKDAYARKPHLDHRRRLATMLIYFEEPGPESYLGGDLVLHDEDGTPVARVTPRPNRAVLFPCSERSWHSVEAVTGCKRPRNMIQVSVSSRHAIWPGGVEEAAPTPVQRLRGLAGRLVRSLKAA